MNMQEIREIARQRGLSRTGRVTRLQLIRNIQSAEGNFPCFATALQAQCDQAGCLWQQDCFNTARKATASRS
jgi:hypothetical protein